MQAVDAPAPGRLLIAGEWRDASSAKTFPTLNPADESVITTVAEAGPEDVAAAVSAARAAFERGAWPAMAAAERARILRKMADLIRERVAKLALLETLDTGKTLFDSGKIEVPFAASLFDFYAGAATTITPRPGGPGRSSL